MAGGLAAKITQEMRSVDFMIDADKNYSAYPAVDRNAYSIPGDRRESDMRILGVRAAPKVASFVVYCCKKKEMKCIDVIKIPQTLSTPEQLKYIRNNILDILREYDVSLAAIRVCEANVQRPSIERLYIEGVIQEAFSSSNVHDYFILRKQGIYSRIGLTSKAYDDAIAGDLPVMGIDTSEYDSATNEAILSALAAGAHK